MAILNKSAFVLAVRPKTRNLSFMKRNEFKARFGTSGPVVLPVIHVLDTQRTLENIDVLTQAGAQGCFLINHDFGVVDFLPIICQVRAARPDLWIGLNFLAITGVHAFPVLGHLKRDGCPIDAYWADDARIEEHGETQAEAEEMARIRTTCGWDGLYFGGTAFKKQRAVSPDDYEASARNAVPFMDVVCTSGVATGQEADLGKIDAFRRGIGDAPMALASGVTPDNARDYADVDCFMVATGINHPGSFYDIDPTRLAALMAVVKEIGGTA